VEEAPRRSPAAAAAATSVETVAGEVMAVAEGTVSSKCSREEDSTVGAARVGAAAAGASSSSSSSSSSSRVGRMAAVRRGGCRRRGWGWAVRG